MLALLGPRRRRCEWTQCTVRGQTPLEPNLLLQSMPQSGLAAEALVRVRWEEGRAWAQGRIDA